MDDKIEELLTAKWPFIGRDRYPNTSYQRNGMECGNGRCFEIADLAARLQSGNYSGLIIFSITENRNMLMIDLECDPSSTDELDQIVADTEKNSRFICGKCGATLFGMHPCDDEFKSTSSLLERLKRYIGD